MTEHDTAQPDHPNTLVRPPRLYLGALLVGGGLEYFVPSPDYLPAPWQYAGGGALVVIGLALAFICFARFRAAGTNVPTVRPTIAIVTTGPYGFSRNPIYVALTLVYLGVTGIVDSVWMLGLLAPVLAVMHYGVIRREEAYLERKFRDEYRSYKGKVRRWL